MTNVCKEKFGNLIFELSKHSKVQKLFSFKNSNIENKYIVLDQNIIKLILDKLISCSSANR